MIFLTSYDRELNILGVCGCPMRAPTLHLRGEYQVLMVGTLLSLQGVAQLVARTAGGREVAGSSPVTLTM